MSLSEDVTQVWEAWKSRQRRPSCCVFSSERKKLISSRLKLGYETKHLLTLIRYAYESQDRQPRWWRGDNPDGTRYTGLDQLLRLGKLGDRVDAAMNWAADLEEGTADLSTEPVLRRGKLALYRGGSRGRGTAIRVPKTSGG